MRVVSLPVVIVAILLQSIHGYGQEKPISEADFDVKKGARPYVNPPTIPIEVDAAPNVDPTKTLRAEERLKISQGAADYLCRVLDEQGFFVYEFNPLANANTPAYNWLRHAGSIISLCQVYGETKDAKYLAAAVRAAAALKKQTQAHNFRGEMLTAIVSSPKITKAKLDRPVVKTGACALGAIAFMKIDEATGKDTHKQTVLKLCQYIRYTQLPNGELRSKYVIAGNQSYYMKWVSTYYQGEALVALAMACKKYPNKDNRRAMYQLLDYLVRKMRKVNRLTVPNAVFDHWATIGLSLAYPQLNDNELGYYGGREPLNRANLLDIIFKFCKNELDTQHLEPGHRLYGCFEAAKGRTQALATRLEGLIAFVDLLRSLKETKYKDQIGLMEKQINMGRQFLASCQYKADDVEKFKTKIRVAGAFRAQLYLRTEKTADGKGNERIPGADSVRIDSCQHAISAMLGW